jgi:hypothetical protein
MWVISNGADLTQWTALPPSRHPQPGLFFLGSAGRAWHGTDKIIQLARLRPAWRFELVGPSPDDLSDSLPDNVTAHGHLLPADYTPIMARCDVAIASLAIHRNAMQQACPLKVREYLARGLPTIIGYQDPDFNDHDPFILRLPNTPDNTCRGDSLAAIDRFLTRWKGQRVGWQQIQHVDIRVKEDQRLALFQHLL